MKILTQSQVHAAIKLKPRELKVYLTLVSYYNDKYGYAFPTIEQIGEVTDIGKADIYAVLNKLEEKSFIRREKNPNKKFNRNNIYYILDKKSEQKEKEIKIMKRKIKMQSFEGREKRTFHSKGYKRRTARVIDSFRSPEAIKCRSTHELYDVWTALNEEKKLYPEDAVTYTYIQKFIQDECESR